MKKVFVATYPFGICEREPKDLLEDSSDLEVQYNSLGRRLKAGEVGNFLEDAHGVIAGTEPYTKEELDKTKNLKVISRVGVGLDNIDFVACKEKCIAVTYTPEAPSDGVADLTIAQIINLLRGIFASNKLVHAGLWSRTMGRLIKEVKIGVLGVGRIGKRIIRRLKGFDAIIYACDIEPDYSFGEKYNIHWLNKRELFEKCDLVTIHIPLNEKNFHCVGIKEMSIMKEGSFLINTSRGPILDEKALESILENKHLAGVALDVFDKEPYSGPLKKFDNAILTAHISSSAHECRYLMELGAAKDCINVLRGINPDNPVPGECWT